MFTAAAAAIPAPTKAQYSSWISKFKGTPFLEDIEPELILEWS